MVATWGGGEQKGQAPLSFEVPKNSKVHFEFSKTGFFNYAMDLIADQAQQVKAVLKPTPVAEKVENKDSSANGKKKKSDREKRAQELPNDGVIDLGDALK